MYLPRTLISHLYLQLLQTQHALSPPVLILVALEPDALCACRILAALLKRDYIPHKIKPILGYGDLAAAGEDMVKPMRLSEGGSGGVIVCLGVGGLVPLGEYLGLEEEESNENGADGVNAWVFDARRPYNLANVFGSLNNTHQAASYDGRAVRKEPGVDRGQLSRGFKSDKGGVIVFDDGDIQEELVTEREAYFALEGMGDEIQNMPHLAENGEDDVYASDSDEEDATTAHVSPRKKRKSWDRDDEDEDEQGDGSGKENARPRQRRRSNSVS